MFNTRLKNRAKKQNIRKFVRPQTDVKKISFPINKFFLMAILIIPVLSSAIYFTAKYIESYLNSPIEYVEIEGDFNYLQKEELLLKIEGHVTGSFIKADLLDIKKTLTEYSWIDTVYLRRIWPNKLKIQIIEQNPIARWSTRGFVNYRGELVALQENSMLKHLPVLVGPDEDSDGLIHQYQKLSLILNKNNLKIYELEKRPLGGWNIYLVNGWKIIGGRSNVSQKLQRLMTMISNNKIGQLSNAVVFDLRYENGVAVRQQDMSSELAVN